MTSSSSRPARSRRSCERAGLGFHETVSAEIFDVMSKHPDLWHSRKGLQFVLGTVATAPAARLRAGGRCLRTGTDGARRACPQLRDAPVRGEARRAVGDAASGAVDLPLRLPAAGICARDGDLRARLDGSSGSFWWARRPVPDRSDDRAEAECRPAGARAASGVASLSSLDAFAATGDRAVSGLVRSSAA